MFGNTPKTLLWYPASKNATEYELPQTVTSIGSYAFHSAAKLSKADLWIEAPIEKGDKSYVGPFNGGLTSISPRAFSYSAVSEIHIPSSLKSIGDDAFYECENLSDYDGHASGKVYFEGKRREWNGIQFNMGNYRLTSAEIICADTETGEESRSEFDSVVEETTRTGRNAVARVYCSPSASGAEMWCASYDRDGRFLSLETYGLTTGKRNEARFFISDETTEMRLFVMDGGAAPLCPCASFHPSAASDS